MATRVYYLLWLIAQSYVGTVLENDRIELPHRKALEYQKHWDPRLNRKLEQ